METTRRRIAVHPPMGWNSYDYYSYTLTESDFLRNLDAFDRLLKPYGWEYLVIDFLWYAPGLKPGNGLAQDDQFHPWSSMDTYGRFLPSPDRYPSALEGRGFQPLVERTHGRGLKFGIHIMRGVPRQAVHARCPILGTAFTAADIADPKSLCPWNNYMYGLDMKHPGAQAYLDSMFSLYAEWEIDFIKVDDLTSPYSEAEIEGYATAIARCGRPMVFSASPGETPIDKAAHISAYVDLWRISPDFWDEWPLLKQQFRRLADWRDLDFPNGHPDADMIPFGELSLRGPIGLNRYAGFTADEKQTLMSLWLIAGSPLIIGGHLDSLDPDSLRLFTSVEALRLNRLVREPRQHSIEHDFIVWTARVDGIPEARYAAFFNTGDQMMHRRFPLSSIGIAGDAVGQDLWRDVRTPVSDGILEVVLAPHASALYLIVPR